MSWAYSVEAFFGFGIDVGGEDLSNKDYVVACYSFGIENTFEISDGVGKQNRINFLSGLGLAGGIGEFVGVTARPGAEEEGVISHISGREGDGETLRMADNLRGVMLSSDGDSHHWGRA